MSICQNCVHYEAPTEEDNRESCSCAGDEAAFQMGLSPSWALTVLIDSKQIENCQCFTAIKKVKNDDKIKNNNGYEWC